MKNNTRLETIAVIAAVVLFILIDILLLFSFISVFDSSESSTHGSVYSSVGEVLHPSIGGTSLRGSDITHSIPIMDDDAIQSLKTQLNQAQTIIFNPDAQ